MEELNNVKEKELEKKGGRMRFLARDNWGDVQTAEGGMYIVGDWIAMAVDGKWQISQRVDGECRIK